MSREQWGAEIDRKLIKVWTELTSIKPKRAEAALRVLSGKRFRKSDLPTEEEFVQLDEIIIEQGATLGWRLMTSGLVLYRFSRWSWEPFRPELFIRLGKELTRSVRILAKRERPPIDDPGLREYKKRTVPELRSVLRMMRQYFSKRPSIPNDEELTIWFLLVISDGERFPNLAANQLYWVAFLKSDDNNNVLSTQMKRRLGPAGLFDSWLAFCKGHDPEYLRKKIVSLSSSQ